MPALTISISPGSLCFISFCLFATAPPGHCGEVTGIEAGVGAGAAAGVDTVVIGVNSGVGLGVCSPFLANLQLSSGIMTYSPSS